MTNTVSKKEVWKIILQIVLLVLTFGVLLPWLFSAKSAVAVFLGFAVVLAWGAFYLNKFINFINTNINKENK